GRGRRRSATWAYLVVPVDIVPLDQPMIVGRAGAGVEDENADAVARRRVVQHLSLAGITYEDPVAVVAYGVVGDQSVGIRDVAVVDAGLVVSGGEVVPDHTVCRVVEEDPVAAVRRGVDVLDLALIRAEEEHAGAPEPGHGGVFVVGPLNDLVHRPVPGDRRDSDADAARPLCVVAVAVGRRRRRLDDRFASSVALE